jgi:hypothetical protein
MNIVPYRTQKLPNSALAVTSLTQASKRFVSSDLEWIGQYRAALNEADASKWLTRIDEAERTLKQALRRAIEKGDSDQRHRISEALDRTLF